jgi:hypothetical protein
MIVFYGQLGTAWSLTTTLSRPTRIMGPMKAPRC